MPSPDWKPAPAAAPALASLAINTIKFLSIDAIEQANSGHPGLPLGAADYAFILWSRYLKHDPRDPAWPDRDRFVLSGGHGSMLLYSLLHLSGYDLPLDELKRFRQWGSKTPGHPEVHLTPGVECTTGPLGQGFANGVGMALAAKLADARLPGLFSHRIWGIVTDGDLMEGVAAEAASLAGHLGLGNLSYLYDDNQITLDGSLDESMSEDVAKRFDAYGWRTRTIDGHDHGQIERALDEACAETARPMLILCRTHIGNGAPNKHDTHKVHGEPLGKAETEAMRKALSWPSETFVIPDGVRALWKQRAEELAGIHAAWREHEQSWCAANPDGARLWQALRDKEVPADLLDQLAAAAPTEIDATRSTAGVILQRAAALVPSLIGGDADLGGSTKTPIKDSPKVARGKFGGRNLRFGIREHAMASMCNGIALHGLFIPYGATFLTFSDYNRPAIRLAALSHVQNIQVYTHDSVFLGEDGPTHQAVEHAAALRLIPELDVWRPGDGRECAAAWAAAIERKHGPTVLLLSRQKVGATPPLGDGHPGVRDAARGGYVLVREAGDSPELIFLATGSEVGLAVEAAALLSADGRRVRVVSLPCLEVFDRQDAGYRESVLPKQGRRISIEAGRTDGWRGRVGDGGLAIGIDRFGASAPAAVIARELGFTGPQIAERVRAFLCT